MGRNYLILLYLALVLLLALQTNARKIPSQVKVSTNQKDGHEQVTDEKNIVFWGLGGYAVVGGVSLGVFPVLGGGAGTFGGVGSVTGSGLGGGLGGPGGLGGGIPGGGAGGLLPWTCLMAPLNTHACMFTCVRITLIYFIFLRKYSLNAMVLYEILHFIICHITWIIFLWKKNQIN